ncbi:acid protease [Obba rivulosa]|uniref:Acid protease n=1 Tax=Obba rivulosa TaxID=1052685 RepID=A0A8E2AZ60_9APHY|nr:acid protease [Obba rivulosa]
MHLGTECGAPCANQIAFDPSKSSTYVFGDDVSEFPFDTGVGVDPVINDDYVLLVRNGSDAVGIGPYTVPDMPLFTIINQTAAFQIDPFSGILGMSSDSRFFLGGLINQGLPRIRIFSYFRDVSHAELTLGVVDESKIKGPLKYSALFGGAGGQWAINSPAIYVNGKTGPVLATERDGIIFDSGTSNIFFDTETAEAIYALISPDIKPFAAEPGAYGIPCSEIHKLPAKIDIAFNGTDGLPFNLTIPSSELSVGPFKSNSSVCQTLINVSDEFEGYGLVGGSLLKHYYSIWDLGNQQMGFARNSELSHHNPSGESFDFFPTRCARKHRVSYVPCSPKREPLCGVITQGD